MFLFSPVIPNLPNTSYINNFHVSLSNQIRTINRAKSNFDLTFSSLKSSFSFSQEAIENITKLNEKINSSFECISRAINALITVIEEAKEHQKELNSAFEDYQKQIKMVRELETPENVKAEGESLKLFLHKLIEFNNESNSIILCCNSIFNSGFKNFIKEINDAIKLFDMINIDKKCYAYDGLDELIDQLTKEVADIETKKCNDNNEDNKNDI